MDAAAHNNEHNKTPVKVASKHIIAADCIQINKELGVGEFGVVQQGIMNILTMHYHFFLVIFWFFLPFSPCEANKLIYLFSSTKGRMKMWALNKIAKVRKARKAIL